MRASTCAEGSGVDGQTSSMEQLDGPMSAGPAAKRKLRVLHLLGGRESGGITTAVATLLNGLVARSIDPSVLILRSNSLAADGKLDRFHPFYLQKRRSSLLTALEIARFCQRQKIDILHTHSVSSNWYGRIAGLLTRGTTVITTVHSKTADTLRGSCGSNLWETLLGQLDLNMHRLSRELITVSYWLREELIARQVAGHKIHAVPHGISSSYDAAGADELRVLRDKLQIPADAPIVGIVGRLTHVKNHPLALKALQILLTRKPSVRLLVVGDGPLRDELETMARDLGVSKRTRFVGWVENTSPYLQLLDILVSSSVSEGFGYAVLEAMAVGKPIVATRVSDMPRLIEDGRSGCLTPPGDAAAMAQALDGLLSDPDLRRQMGLAARRRAMASYSLDQEIERHLEVYDRVWRNQAPPGGSVDHG